MAPDRRILLYCLAAKIVLQAISDETRCLTVHVLAFTKPFGPMAAPALVDAVAQAGVPWVRIGYFPYDARQGYQRCRDAERRAVAELRDVAHLRMLLA